MTTAWIRKWNAADGSIGVTEKGIRTWSGAKYTAECWCSVTHTNMTNIIVYQSKIRQSDNLASSRRRQSKNHNISTKFRTIDKLYPDRQCNFVFTIVLNLLLQFEWRRASLLPFSLLAVYLFYGILARDLLD